MNDKTKTPSSVKAGDTVRVLDWSVDPNNPTESTAVVAEVNTDGSINTDTQTGLQLSATETLTPGTFAVVKPGKPSTPNPVPPPGSPSH